MLFTRRNEAIERQSIFAHVGVSQQRDFRVQFAEPGVSRKRDLYEVANAANVDQHFVRSFFGEASAQLANHRCSESWAPVLPPFLRLSTRVWVCLQAGEK